MRTAVKRLLLGVPMAVLLLPPAACAPLWERQGPVTADLEALVPTLAALESWDGYDRRETYGAGATQWDFRGC